MPRTLSSRQACYWIHLPKPQLSDREGYLQALQGVMSSRDGMGQAHSINKCGLCYFKKPNTQWIQSSVLHHKDPPVHSWERPTLHTHAPSTHTLCTQAPFGHLSAAGVCTWQHSPPSVGHSQGRSPNRSHTRTRVPGAEDSRASIPGQGLERGGMSFR